MLNAIVPPPMLFASRIAWRNEPVPESLVFVTVKTNGVAGLFTSGVPSPVERVVPNALATRAASPPDICALGELSAIVFRRSRSTLATPEASKIEQADNKATARMIRSAKADGELFCFFFILFFGVEIQGRSPRYSPFLYREASLKSPGKCDRGALEDTRS